MEGRQREAVIILQRNMLASSAHVAPICGAEGG